MMNIGKRLETLSFDPGTLSVRMSGYGEQNYSAELIFDWSLADHRPNEEDSGSHIAIDIPHSELIAIRDFLNRVIPLEPAADSEFGSADSENRLTLDTDKQVFFYEQEFYVLSNFSAFSLIWKGERFDTSEAAYQWEKFAHNNGQNHECDTCYVIRRSDSAHAAFKIAEANRHTRRPDWDAVRVSIMRDILRAKVQQHGYVRQKLMQTGDRELIEHSWRDDFWGWGPNRDGQNMLGKLWMEIRAELRAEAE